MKFVHFKFKSCHYLIVPPKDTKYSGHNQIIQQDTVIGEDSVFV